MKEKLGLYFQKDSGKGGRSLSRVGGGGKENESTRDSDAMEGYRQNLLELRQLADKLGIEPDEIVIVIPGTEGEGKPLGAPLPVVSKDPGDISEEGMKATVFNLRSLLNFEPPRRRR